MLSFVKVLFNGLLHKLSVRIYLCSLEKVLTSDFRKKQCKLGVLKNSCLYWRNEVLGWQESTLKIHILELQSCYSFIIQCYDKAFVTRLCQGALWQPYDNLATTLLQVALWQPCDIFKTQGCARVVKKHCGKVVTTLSFLYGWNIESTEKSIDVKYLTLIVPHCALLDKGVSKITLVMTQILGAIVAALVPHTESIVVSRYYFHGGRGEGIGLFA